MPGALTFVIASLTVPWILQDFSRNYRQLLAFYSRERGADVEALELGRFLLLAVENSRAIFMFFHFFRSFPQQRSRKRCHWKWYLNSKWPTAMFLMWFHEVCIDIWFQNKKTWNYHTYHIFTKADMIFSGSINDSYLWLMLARYIISLQSLQRPPAVGWRSNVPSSSGASWPKSINVYSKSWE